MVRCTVQQTRQREGENGRRGMGRGIWNRIEEKGRKEKESKESLGVMEGGAAEAVQGKQAQSRYATYPSALHKLHR